MKGLPEPKKNSLSGKNRTLRAGGRNGKMERANPHYLLGFIWHITHRCHKQEFISEFPKDRPAEEERHGQQTGSYGQNGYHYCVR
jgi:hypothetical protein